VIDAAGAIYVIGGESRYVIELGSASVGNNLFNDVLKSADGGADQTWGALRGSLSGALGDFGGFLPRWSRRTQGVHKVCQGVV
jgi:hypothetical protein